ncbi:uncharacterized protein [Tursiops truncatus]|uniref:uncharacterized protein n=1 Tax=Tursiops truncatus TaxID=9739 RepID=UPI003CCFCDBC
MVIGMFEEVPRWEDQAPSQDEALPGWSTCKTEQEPRTHQKAYLRGQRALRAQRRVLHQLSRIALTHHVEKRWRPHRVFSPQYFCRQATASRIPAHHLDQLPRPAAIKSLAESFSVASGVHDARARLFAGQWERGRRQQGRQPPKRPSRPGPAPSTPYPRPPSRPHSFPEGSRWGAAPGPALRPALDAGKTLATEPLLRSVGTHLGGRSQSDVHGRTVGRVGYCGGLGRTRADPVVYQTEAQGKDLGVITLEMMCISAKSPRDLLRSGFRRELKKSKD